MPPGSLKGLVLETDDLEGTISEMASKGFTIDAEIDSQPWGRFVSFDDPDGNASSCANRRRVARSDEVSAPRYPR